MSSPVVVVATLQVQPGTDDQAHTAITACIEATHGEAGCEAYALHRDLGDPTTFVLVEKWASVEELDAHGTQPHVAALFAAIGPIAAAPPVVRRLSAVPAGDAGKGAL